MKIYIKKFRKGMSLIEILVVVAVFAILSVLVTRSVVVTLRGARKSDDQIRVKEELSYAMSVMERQLRSAAEFPECPLLDPTIIKYTSYEGEDLQFSCSNGGNDDAKYYVASGSGNLRITTNQVKVTSCKFTCERDTAGDPPKITIEITGQDNLSSGTDKAVVTVKTEITGRNYQNY